MVRQIGFVGQAVLLVVLALAAGLTVRFFVVEVPEYSWACQAQAMPWWCPLRIGVMWGLRAGLLGGAALVAGLVALWRLDRRWARVALGVGAAGLVLYGPVPAAGGLLMGALAGLRA